MDNPAYCAHLAARFFELCPDISCACSLTGPGLAVDENIRRGFVPEGWCKNRCNLLDLGFPVREDLGSVRVPEHLPVFEYPVIGEIFFE